MIASKKSILVDSNILVYAINRSSPKHLAAQQFLQSNAGNLVLAQQNILETLRVMTHKKFTNPMPEDEAVAAVTAIADVCRIIAPDLTTYHLVQMLIKEHRLTGNSIFDAYLAATALSSGVLVIATDNQKDFIIFKDIKVINPFI